MRVEFTEPVRLKLRKYGKTVRLLVGMEIRKFQDGSEVDMKKLKGSLDKWRISAGAWRIILKQSKEDTETVYSIIGVVQRKDAYK